MFLGIWSSILADLPLLVKGHETDNQTYILIERLLALNPYLAFLEFMFKLPICQRLSGHVQTLNIFIFFVCIYKEPLCIREELSRRLASGGADNRGRSPERSSSKCCGLLGLAVWGSVTGDVGVYRKWCLSNCILPRLITYLFNAVLEYFQLFGFAS